ncbi:MAG TPA: VOC family protein [Albitalea sp.]|uniref:VOC family protein n=1 Tax=Piscinibacter sp. TaxID=1903157 RepID=UPI002ED1ACC8
MTLALDHIVVAARTLADGVQWCEATLGVTPDAGGRHALMSTHNRLLAIGSPAFARAYLEIIAIDPEAPAPGRARWYDLDDPALQAALAGGPRLIHWVLGCDRILERTQALRDAGLDTGEVLDVQRGALRWRLGVRPDGRRLGRGAVPTLIEWPGPHPSDQLPASSVSLERLTVCGVAPAAAALCDEAGVLRSIDGPPLVAVLSTPRGRVELRSTDS